MKRDDAWQASERIPLSVCGLHCTVTMLAWVGVALAKGDYRYRAPCFLFGAHRTVMLVAGVSAAATWVRRWRLGSCLLCEPLGWMVAVAGPDDHLHPCALVAAGCCFDVAERSS
jgi:hypothetical protein